MFTETLTLPQCKMPIFRACLKETREMEWPLSKWSGPSRIASYQNNLTTEIWFKFTMNRQLDCLKMQTHRLERPLMNLVRVKERRIIEGLDLVLELLGLLMSILTTSRMLLIFSSATSMMWQGMKIWKEMPVLCQSTLVIVYSKLWSSMMAIMVLRISKRNFKLG